MRINVGADELLSKYFKIQRIGNLDFNKKEGVLLEINNEVKLYSSSSRVYGEAVLESEILNVGRLLIPKTIIPVLKELGDRKISLRDTKDYIIIEYGSNKIELNLFYNMNSISTRPSVNWDNGIDISKVDKIIHSAGETLDGMDLVWIINGHLVTGNRYKFSVYDSGSDFSMNHSIETLPFKLIKGEDTIQIKEENDFVYLGNREFNVSVPKVIKEIKPQMLDLLTLDLEPKCVVDLGQLKSIASISKYLSLGEEYSTANIIKVENNSISVIPYGNSIGRSGALSTVAYTSDIFETKISTIMLNEVLDNCIGGEVSLGLHRIYNIDIFYIMDHDIVHYIVPMY